MFAAVLMSLTASAGHKDALCGELPGDAMRAAKEQLQVDFT